MCNKKKYLKTNFKSTVFGLLLLNLKYKWAIIPNFVTSGASLQLGFIPFKSFIIKYDYKLNLETGENFWSNFNVIFHAL